MEDAYLLSQLDSTRPYSGKELWTDKITLDKEEEIPLLTSDE